MKRLLAFVCMVAFVLSGIVLAQPVVSSNESPRISTPPTRIYANPAVTRPSTASSTVPVRVPPSEEDVSPSTSENYGSRYNSFDRIGNGSNPPPRVEYVPASPWNSASAEYGPPGRPVSPGNLVPQAHYPSSYPSTGSHLGNRVRVSLIDGSLVQGKLLGIDSVQLDTDFGTLDVPLEKLLGIAHPRFVPAYGTGLAPPHPPYNPVSPTNYDAPSSIPPPLHLGEKVRVVLKDGSLAMGKLSEIDSIQLKTDLGTLDVPLEKLASLRRDVDGSIALNSVSGDQISGTVSIETISVIGGMLGPLELSIEDVEAITPDNRSRVFPSEGSTSPYPTLGTNPHVR